MDTNIIGRAVIEILVSKEGIRTDCKAAGIQISAIIFGLELEKQKLINQALGSGRPTPGVTFEPRRV